MTQVRITDISGGTYPINVYIADVYGNNQSLLGDINIQNSSCVFGVTLADPSCFINGVTLDDPSC